MPYPGYTGEYVPHFRAVSDTENFDCAPGTEALRIPGEGTAPKDVMSKQGFDEYMQERAKREGEKPTCNNNALSTQVAGSHYKQLKIQPVEYINANDLDFLQGNVVKYITRHKNKGKADDVRKALHFCQLILELQYGEQK